MPAYNPDRNADAEYSGPEIELLVKENAELRRKHDIAIQYIREKVNQLLSVMGTLPLKTEELDDDTLLDIDPIGIVSDSFAQVLSHLHETNDKLELAHDEIRAIFDSAGVGIVLLDREMRVQAYNKKQTELFITDEACVIGVPCYKVICGHEGPADVCTFMQLMAKGELIRRKDWISSNGRHFDVIATPVKNKSGDIVYVVMTYLDITERKRLAEDMLRLQKVEAAGIFAGGIAHDFNNLLTTILGNISIAKTMSSAKDPIYDKLVHAEKASFKARDLTYRLLTFAGGGGPVRKTVPIHRLVKEAADFALSFSSIGCDYYMDEDLWESDVDEGQIKKVIHNLVVNACEAMPGEGTISISARNITIKAGDFVPLGEGRYIKITVQDRGIGIPEENLPRIFDPYFTTKEMGSSKGTGLGLAVSFSIIRNHGGYISVASRVGVGTTCDIYLPASIKEGASDGLSDNAEIRGKILLMDDEELVREVSGDMMRHLGYDVTFAADGTEFLDIYVTAMEAGSPFDAVVMDLNISGGMGGEETMEKLREIDPAVRAIVSSGNITGPIVSDFRRYGFCGVINKPFKMQELRRVLHELKIRNNV